MPTRGQRNALPGLWGTSLVYLVVRVFAALVFGEIAYAFELRELDQQLLLNTFLQGHIHHGTAVTAAAKLQDSQTVFGDFHQRNASAVACQLWVNPDTERSVRRHRR